MTVTICLVTIVGFFPSAQFSEADNSPVVSTPSIQCFNGQICSILPPAVNLPVLPPPAPVAVQKTPKARRSTPIVSAPARSGDVEQWRGLVSQYDWPVDTALAIMQCESGGRQDATHVNRNGSIDRGLFQINSVHGAHSTFDPAANIAYAYVLYSGSRSWGDWTTYTNGCYKQFLP